MEEILERRVAEVSGWSRIFFPTPDVQLDYFLHQTLKLRIPVEMVQFLLKQRFLAVHHDFH